MGTHVENRVLHIGPCSICLFLFFLHIVNPDDKHVDDDVDGVWVMVDDS